MHSVAWQKLAFLDQYLALSRKRYKLVAIVTREDAGTVGTVCREYGAVNKMSS